MEGSAALTSAVPVSSGSGGSVASARRGTGGKIWAEVLTQAVAVGGLLWALKVCLSYLDPYREQRDQAKKRAAFLKRHLGVTLELNEFEQLLVTNVLNPAHIDVTLADVHGLDNIIQQLHLKVILPLLQPTLYSTSLLRQTKGVLLYGPPGTGKTMLAKALARESGCFFLNITASSIMSKWLGDANRLVRAVFTLAQQLAPCIIFIDEVDAMLGKRGSSQEHEATLQVKTEFMALWDGMESARGQRVVVMGATNRPWMVDEAVLRRFTLQYEIGLPSLDQRRDIVLGYLHKHVKECGKRSVAPELLGTHEASTSSTSSSAPASGHKPATSSPSKASHAPQLPPRASGASASHGSASQSGSADGKARAPSSSSSSSSSSSAGTASAAPRDRSKGLDWLVQATEGFSGSDLLELCSQAAQHVLEEHWMEAHRRGDAVDASSLQLLSLRALDAHDFEAALRHIQPAAAKANEYSTRDTSFTSAAVDPAAQAAMLQALTSMLAASAPKP